MSWCSGIVNIKRFLRSTIALNFMPDIQESFHSTYHYIVAWETAGLVYASQFCWHGCGVMFPPPSLSDTVMLAGVLMYAYLHWHKIPFACVTFSIWQTDLSCAPPGEVVWKGCVRICKPFWHAEKSVNSQEKEAMSAEVVCTTVSPRLPLTPVFLSCITRTL